ncbi:hypothetical protein PFISCL1PPCAC_9915 [Pristionchus fissidentatus]|uniref:Uncharacterized protein n=1 Tax=Pristionchus fissidentatus TaxID=1538716 RepID=A0AAV5VH14_9BILA|nr:hypothetical protein PFISCL1PPCAC_9915 [Pristionchus fissidentatus]
MSEFSSEQGRLASNEVDPSATVHVYPTGTLSLYNEVISIDSFKINCHCPNEDHDYLAHSEVEMETPKYGFQEEEEWNNTRSDPPRFQFESSTNLLRMDTSIEDSAPREVANLDHVLHEMGEGDDTTTGNEELFRGVRLVIQSQIPVPEVSERFGLCITTLYEYVDNAREGLRILAIADQQMANPLDTNNSELPPSNMFGEWCDRSLREVHAPSPILVDSLTLPNGTIASRDSIWQAISQVVSRLGNALEVKSRVWDALVYILIEGRSTWEAAEKYSINASSLDVCVYRVLKLLDDVKVEANLTPPNTPPAHATDINVKVPRSEKAEVILPNGTKSTIGAIQLIATKVVQHNGDANSYSRIRKAILRVLVERMSVHAASIACRTPKKNLRMYVASILHLLGCPMTQTQMEEWDVVTLPSGEKSSVEAVNQAITKAVSDLVWSKGYKTRICNAIKRVLVDGIETEEAAKKHNISIEVLHSRLSRVLQLLGEDLVIAPTGEKEEEKSPIGKSKRKRKKMNTAGEKAVIGTLEESIEENLEKRVPSQYTFGEGNQSITLSGKALINVEGVILPSSKNLLEQVIDLDLVDSSKRKPFIGTKDEFILNLEKIIFTVDSSINQNVLISNLVSTLINKEGEQSESCGRLKRRKMPNYQLMRYHRLITLIYNPITIVDSDGNQIKQEDSNSKQNESFFVPPHTFGEGQQSITVPMRELFTVEGVLLPRSKDLLYKLIDLDLINPSHPKSFKGTKEQLEKKITEIVCNYGVGMKRRSLLLDSLVEKRTLTTEGSVSVSKLQRLIKLFLDPITIIPDESTHEVSDNEEVDETMEEEEEEEEMCNNPINIIPDESTPAVSDNEEVDETMEEREVENEEREKMDMEM